MTTEGAAAILKGMNTEALEALRAFRQQIYSLLGCRRDGLFELIDALLTAPIGRDPVHLSLEAHVRRKWGSVYDALRAGTVPAAAFEHLLGTFPLMPDGPMYAVDASAWPRCDAETSPQRAFYHHSYRHSHGQPIVAGWAYHWIAQIQLQHDSWTAPMRVRRLQPWETINQVACAQIRSVIAQRPPGNALPIFAFDAGYEPTPLVQGLDEWALGIVVRLRAGRCFSADPIPLPAGAPGRPRRHGAKLACANPHSW